MEENKQQNLEQPSVTPVVTKNIFFNVPSKGRMAGPKVGPKVSSVEPVVDTGESGGNDVMETLKKNKTYIIIGVVALIVLSVSGYLVYEYFINSAEKLAEQNQVVVPVRVSEKVKDPVPTVSSSGVTPDWLQRYFNGTECKPELCGDKVDPDRDGLVNLDEFKLGTDPNNPDSDKDNLSDGDEINIFDTSPLQSSTTGSNKFTDSDDAKGGYDTKTPGKKFTDVRLAEIKGRMKQFGLHEPTISTLGDVLISYYAFTSEVIAPPVTGPTTTIPGLDVSPQAVLDRDTQRSATIKKIGVALVKYKNDTGSYPLTESFTEMTNKIKPYNLVATNAQDPVNKEPYIYIYQPSSEGKTFALTYYSESQKSVIKYDSVRAEKDFISEDAGLRDEQRIADVESIRTALMTYSTTKIAGTQSFVFPPVSKYKTELVPQYMATIPKDPKTQTEYDYQVGPSFDSFTLKAVLENPTAGTTGYLCNQEECRKY